MSFLGIGVLEILVILLVAFIFLGPERMMDAARFLARAVREGRHLASSIPRVVVEDDDVKVVQDGRATSLTKQDSDGERVDEERRDDSGDFTGDSETPVSSESGGNAAAASAHSDADGPVPFSRRPSPTPPPPAPADTPPTTGDADDGRAR